MSRPSTAQRSRTSPRIESLERRLFLSTVTTASSLLDTATSAVVQSTNTSVSPKLTVNSTGFSIDAGVVKSTGTQVGFWGYPTVTPQLSNGTLSYVLQGWTIKVTPTEDSQGIHFAVTFVNTGSSAAVAPDFTLCGLSGGLTGMWRNNQTEPFVLDQVLSDGTHCALTVDDPDYPIVGEFMQATNPWNGTENIYFHASGGQYARYDLGLVPIAVTPGASTTFHCSLRFGPDYASVSAATLANWAKTYPYSLNWTDHRQMLRGDLFQYDPTASSPQGFQGGFDINAPANAQRFDDWVMAYAARNIATAKAVNAGTWIEWDLEGKQGGYNYKGNPSLIDVLNPGWAHKDSSGEALIDRFFKAFKDAGIHIGVCVRPWTLTVDAGGNISQDTTVSGVDSVARQMDYAWNRWGLDVFYVDSPQQQQTAAYRAMMLARPKLLMVPEDVPESWLQFSAPMVWSGGNVINWQTVPRTLYGPQGWGVYYHQDLDNPAIVANLLNDAQLGTSVLNDGWMGPSFPGIQTAVGVYAIADPPTVARPASVSDNPVPMTALLSCLGGDNSGEAGLLYHWSSTGPAVVEFSQNDSNAAKNAVASFRAGGTYVFTVTMTDTEGLSTSSSLSMLVRSATTTTLSSSAAVSTLGQSLTLTATISSSGGLPGGSVSFMDGQTLLGTGTVSGGLATFSTAALAGGAHALTAIYSGDAMFTASTGVLTQTVQRAATSTRLVSLTTTSVAGQNVTFTATVSSLSPWSIKPGGTLNFMDGTTLLGTATVDGAGTAVLTVNTLAVGSHSITATYTGNGDYADSTSTPLTQTVGRAQTSTTLTSSLPSSNTGQAVTFTAKVSALAPSIGIPTGIVYFMDGAKLLGTGVLDASGVARFTTTLLAAGSHTITATFMGGDTYFASTSLPLTQTVSVLRQRR
jgi:hypothetical protein